MASVWIFIISYATLSGISYCQDNNIDHDNFHEFNGTANDIFTSDGILIQPLGEIRSVLSLQNVYLHLEKPLFPRNLSPNIVKLGRFLESARDCVQCNYSVDVQTEARWLRRVEELCYHIGNMSLEYENAEGSRDKRNIFNSLYRGIGLATNSDLLKIRDEVHRLSENNQIVYHNSELMSSFVKIFASNVSNHFGMFENSLSQLQNLLEIEMAEMDEFQQKLNDLSFIHNIDMTIQDFELAVSSLRDMITKYHKVLNDLDRQVLTPDLLPERFLEQILGTSDQSSRFSLDLSWYYRNCKVSFMSQDETHIVYKLQLPSLSADSYLKYRIQTFAVPTPDQQILRKLAVPEEVAISQHSSANFNPDNELCFGSFPSACVIYNLNLLKTCASAIIGGELLPTCEFHFQQRNNRTLEISRTRDIHGNDLIILNPLKEITLMRRCTNMAAKPFVLHKLTKIRIPPTCSIDNNEFQIRPIIHTQSDITIYKSYQYIKLRPLNITLPSKISQKFKKHLDVFKSKKLTVEDFPSLEEISNKPLALTSKEESILSLILSAISIGISFGLIFAVCYYLYKHPSCFNIDYKIPPEENLENITVGVDKNLDEEEEEI